MCSQFACHERFALGGVSRSICSWDLKWIQRRWAGLPQRVLVACMHLALLRKSCSRIPTNFIHVWWFCNLRFTSNPSAGGRRFFSGVWGSGWLHGDRSYGPKINVQKRNPNFWKTFKSLENYYSRLKVWLFRSKTKRNYEWLKTFVRYHSYYCTLSIM